MEKPIILWKFNKRTGYWEYQRECLPENAEAWLQVFSKDEPEEFFKLSNNKPNHNPITGKKYPKGK